MLKLFLVISSILGTPALLAADFPEGYSIDLDLSNNRRVSVRATVFERSHPDRTSQPDLVRILRNYAELNGHPLAPVDNEVVVYRLTTSERNSFSPGYARHNQLILAPLNELLAPQNENCEPFSKRDSLAAHILRHKQIDQFVPAATNLATLVQRLSDQTDLIDRHFFVRSCEVNAFEGVVYEAFFIDPTPLSGPDQEGFLVLHRHGWGE